MKNCIVFKAQTFLQTPEPEPIQSGLPFQQGISANYFKDNTCFLSFSCRHGEILTKDNMFGQLTVRFHSQQTLAVYDR